ncbi:MAG: glycosyltransferase [Cytophagaceae bacterium]
MKIFYAGTLSTKSNSFSRMQIFKQEGFDVIPFDFSQFIKRDFFGKLQFRLGIGPDINKLNSRLVEKVKGSIPDLLWIDKGLYIQPSSLKKIKDSFPKAIIVHLNPDDPFGNNQEGFRLFKKSIPFYDVHFVSRPQNVNEYKSFGAKTVFEYDRSFDPNIHRPIQLSETEKSKYHTKVGFVGTFAYARAESILFLIENGIPVSIYGDHWEKFKSFKKIQKYYKGKAVYGLEYAKVISGMEIALHFLRKENRDFQDSRTFEIPACGTFMIAERSYKHEEFFKEDEEAVFFDNNEELLKKVSYYINHPEKREKIAKNALEKSLKAGYDHKNRLLDMINKVLKLKQ